MQVFPFYNNIWKVAVFKIVYNTKNLTSQIDWTVPRLSLAMFIANISAFRTFLANLLIIFNIRAILLYTTQTWLILVKLLRTHQLLCCE